MISFVVILIMLFVPIGFINLDSYFQTILNLSPEQILPDTKGLWKPQFATGKEWNKTNNQMKIAIGNDHAGTELKKSN